MLTVICMMDGNGDGDGDDGAATMAMMAVMMGDDDYDGQMGLVCFSTIFCHCSSYHIKSHQIT